MILCCAHSLYLCTHQGIYGLPHKILVISLCGTSLFKLNICNCHIGGGSRVPEFETDEDREEWEEEQKRLDREWYGLDEGYDDTHNPFSNTSQEYTQKKEKELEERKKKRMTARQRQIHKVCGPLHTQL